MRKTFDGAAFCRMIISAAASIDLQKQKINELNVFPVPDGDTGTNMSMTLEAAVADLRAASMLNLGQAVSLTASALLRGARGNSGVILSLLFRGFAKALKGVQEGDGALFAAALQEGVDVAYKAVMKPAEGTILTVSRLSAEAALEASSSDSGIESVLAFAISAGRIALENTVDQNPVLKKAGVVDAGGMGFLVILEGMLASLQGKDITFSDVQTPRREQADFSSFSTADIHFIYCTEFIVSRENDKNPELLRAKLDKLGDSLVLVADDEIIKVHVHSNHPGVVFEEALAYGSLMTTKIENMRLQHTEKAMGDNDQSTGGIAKPEKEFGVVAVCAGEGLIAAFRDMGADGIIEGGQTMNPSTEDILKQINRTPAKTVFVLPNNKNIIMAAQQTVSLTEKRVVVVPSKTVPQGITALLNFDPDSDEKSIVSAMTDAMADVVTMQITYAARDSDFDGHEIHQGDYLALYNGTLFGTGSDVLALLRELAEKIRDEDKEIVSIFYGSDVSDEEATEATAVFADACPEVEINLLSGGQPVYYYLISAE